MKPKWKGVEVLPPEPGWYPSLRCWDPYEGRFPCAGYWDGKTWEPANVMLWVDESTNELAARDRAYELDPDGPLDVGTPRMY